MFLCYIDESGTSSIPGNTSHFILVGLSIPIWHWKDCDHDITRIKEKYDLLNAEIHTAWILRKYLEQSRIPNFDSLHYSQRRSEVERLRKTALLRLQKSGNSKLYKQTKKNYQKTDDYTHLNLNERRSLILEIAECVSNWGFARLFAECIDKIHFDPTIAPKTIDEQAFEQIVSRFEKFIQIYNSSNPRSYGLLIHDNNETVAKKHTLQMRKYQNSGTLWTSIENIIETPLFVDSQLTSLIQIADLCSYSIRRYLENGETDLFDFVFRRADRKGVVTVGVRHFAPSNCPCKICSAHRP